MPELPEVQTVVTQLSKKIVDKRIDSFQSTWKKNVFPSSMVFARGVRGAVIKGVRRFGKHIVIDLHNKRSIVIHLKMTGHLLVKTRKNKNAHAFTRDPVNGYIRHIFTFTDGTTLEFSDMRKFGWLRILATSTVEALPSIQTLGIDALSPQLSRSLFRERLAINTRQIVGSVLLDQERLAGIGNIYRSEALFLAGIRPMRRVGTLSKEEWQRLFVSVRKVLQHAARLGGMSDGDFRDTDGLSGRFQRAIFVYRRNGLPCKKCGTIIQRKKIGQRSAFYCSRCQC